MSNRRKRGPRKELGKFERTRWERHRNQLQTDLLWEVSRLLKAQHPYYGVSTLCNTLDDVFHAFQVTKPLGQVLDQELLDWIRAYPAAKALR